ncbi:MAG: metal-binding protein, partial [Fuerstia sp.]|nr:metal-binding protein [Fuerstiella sp.]
KKQQAIRERAIRQGAMQTARETVAAGRAPKPTAEMQQQHRQALDRYWKARSQLNVRLREENETLWRRLMPYDPVITVADDVVFFECFSSDESSYGCLTVDRDACFANAQEACVGTTNVDYSWELYHNFQSLRTYRETRFNINPEGFSVQTSDRADYREEKIELPEGWLRGFMQLQAAMALPMKKVTLGVDAVYSLLAWLKRHREKHGPRAIRFVLEDGKSPRLILEPWSITIESPATIYKGAATEPVRIWGRRRLMSLARLLPLATQVDVYLLGTGLPSFWVVQMGGMRLTLGLSGWTTNDWTRGSAVQMLLPPTATSLTQVASAAEQLSLQRAMTMNRLRTDLKCSTENAAAAMNQLALRGQAIFDLHADVFRWRQILPMALSDRELGSPHPELAAAEQIVAAGKVKVETCQEAPRGGSIVTGKVENQSCEVLIDGDGVIRKGKCRCSWHFKFGVRNGPCRHLQALRAGVRSFSE